MRIGQNPAKFVKTVARPRRVTVAVISHIPFLSGFHEGALEVLKASLNSLWESTEEPYDLLVFDNGSGRETTDFLLDAHKAGRIQYLLLGEKNLGKGGAWNVIFAGAPGEVVAYSDSDVFYYPGWLSKALEILETFPKVGMVTSRPFRTAEKLYSATLDWASREPEARLEQGQFVPWEVFREFELSLGQSEQEVRDRYDTTHDFRVTYRGTAAQIGASHFQFVARKSVLQQFLPLKMDRPMGQVLRLDEQLNVAGYLRLMTCEPLVMNMSNSVAGVLRPARQGSPGRSRKRRLLRRIIEFVPIKMVLLGIYARIFRLYYAE